MAYIEASRADQFVTLCRPLWHGAPKERMQSKTLEVKLKSWLTKYRMSLPLYSSIHTSAARFVFLAKILPEPPGNVYGCFLRKTWPTREHGIISKSPPHCHTRKLISKFSPPQTSISMSYSPSSINHCFCILNRPPAIMGVLIGAITLLFRLFRSAALI